MKFVYTFPWINMFMDINFILKVYPASFTYLPMKKQERIKLESAWFTITFLERLLKVINTSLTSYWCCTNTMITLFTLKLFSLIKGANLSMSNMSKWANTTNWFSFVTPKCFPTLNKKYLDQTQLMQSTLPLNLENT